MRNYLPNTIDSKDLFREKIVVDHYTDNTSHMRVYGDMVMYEIDKSYREEGRYHIERVPFWIVRMSTPMQRGEHLFAKLSQGLYAIDHSSAATNNLMNWHYTKFIVSIPVKDGELETTQGIVLGDDGNKCMIMADGKRVYLTHQLSMHEFMQFNEMAKKLYPRVIAEREKLFGVYRAKRHQEQKDRKRRRRR